MSLNGLDNLNIKEAYTSALEKENGWFLLKYASRDEIELLACGDGGIIDIQNILGDYDEPLFGFLRYREKHVLIKYVPKECSRLVQARVTVHLGAITDQFSPTDALVPISSPQELCDTSLSTACSLHTIPVSRSSSTSSLCRRPLLEIAEEADEVVHELDPSKDSERPLSIVNPSTNSERSVSPSKGSYGVSPSRNNADAKTAWNNHQRKAQTSQNENYAFSSQSSRGRHKVKLGPRPSVDLGGRSSPSTASAYRPVSTLPAGLKPFAKACRQEKEQPKARYASESMMRGASSSLSTIVQDHSASPASSADRPLTSSGFSIRSLPSPALSANSKIQAKESAKARLLRAQQMRKKKMEATQSSELAIKLLQPSQPEMTPPGSPTSFADIQPALTMINDVTNFDESLYLSSGNSPLKADDSDGTRSESCSMFAPATSEGAESTKASSISESMEELSQEISSVAPAVEDNFLSSLTLTAPEITEDVDKSDSSQKVDAFSEAETELPILSPTVYTSAKTSSDKLTFPKEVHDLIEPAEENTVDTNQKNLTNGIGSESNNTGPAIEIVLDAEEKETSDLDCSTSEEDILSPVTSFTKCSCPVPQREVIESECTSSEPATEQIAVAPVQSHASCWDVPRSKFSIPRSKFSVPYALQNSSKQDAHLHIDEGLSILNRRSSRRMARTHEPKNNNSDQSGVPCADVRTDPEVTPLIITESDANFSSDDEFMEELQSAVFEDARPVSVAKSLSSISPIPRNCSETNLITRTSLAPFTKDESNSSKTSNYSRSENSKSAEFLTRVNSQPTASMARKSNLGSSISQRIKALEKLSAQDPDQNSTPVTIAVVPTFFPVRKANCATSSNGNHPSQSNLPQASQSRTYAPLSSESFASPSNFLSDSAFTSANNLRDQSQQTHSDSTISKEPKNFSSGGTYDHVSEEDRTPKSSTEPRLEPKTPVLCGHLGSNHQTSLKERRSSFAVIIDLFMDRQRSSAIESRRSVSLENSGLSSPKSLQTLTNPPFSIKGPKRNLSFASRCSSSGRDAEQEIPSPQNFIPTSSDTEEKSENRSSRASWVLSKMSSSISASRKSITHVPASPSSPVDSHPVESPAIIGDVNVQFPDTLLWKRKTMLLDSQGNLIMAPFMSTHNGKTTSTYNAVASRKFPMRDFKLLYTPDVEVEELPNSVILDFFDGTSLQIACEHRMDQERILYTLQDAHQRWKADLQ